VEASNWPPTPEGAAPVFWGAPLFQSTVNPFGQLPVRLLACSLSFRPLGNVRGRMFLYRLCGRDGDDLGDYQAAVSSWQPGDSLYLDGNQPWRVTAVIDGADLPGDHYQAVLEIERV
jgi:hypothetical protein